MFRISNIDSGWEVASPDQRDRLCDNSEDGRLEASGEQSGRRIDPKFEFGQY